MFTLFDYYHDYNNTTGYLFKEVSDIKGVCIEHCVF